MHQLAPWTLPPNLPSPGAPGKRWCCPGPPVTGGAGQAWLPGNILAQNYIRLEVSIFCSILLPDLIVHLWQCLYTSRVQDNSVAAATGARQRCNLEINSFRVCLFQGETPSLSPGRVSPAPPPPRSPHPDSRFCSLPTFKEAPWVPQSWMEVRDLPCNLYKLLHCPESQFSHLENGVSEPYQSKDLTGNVGM